MSASTKPLRREQRPKKGGAARAHQAKRRKYQNRAEEPREQRLGRAVPEHLDDA